MPPKVLLAEGYPLLRTALSALLASSGFWVAGAYASLNELTLGMRELGAALVLSDPGMEDVSAAVGELRNLFPNVAVLMLGVPRNSEEIDRYYRTGAAGYLDLRAVSEKTLIEAIQLVLHGERVFPLNLIQLSSPSARAHRDSPLLGQLSLREREVLTFVAAGADNLKIAALLRISERTVKAHISSLYRKLGSENRTQLALGALQLGLRPSSQV